MNGPKILSTGSFIIDDILITDDNGVQKALFEGVLGGGGVHTIVGSRLWYSGISASELGYIVLVGSNCPIGCLDALEDLGMSLLKIPVELEPHPRAINYFKGTSGTRGFEFTTPEKSYATHFRVRVEHLPEAWMKSLEAIHLLMSGDRVIEWVTKYEARSKAFGISKLPKFIWEPSPASCTPSQWDSFERALKLVSVVSPNHEEGMDLAKGRMVVTGDGLEDLKSLAKLLSESIIRCGSKAHLIIRAAHMGCLVVPNSAAMTCSFSMVPAFWAADDSSRVRDVTGAGNALMGGLMAGLVKGKDVVEAAHYGSISSSFTIEVIGIPNG
ncbi:hypothetical protein HDU67_001986 [Dinochytrium kinnereticum]|nr:hypothetical protein HDU67_001986 [Dinochytrium kinnereticum]